MKREPFDGWYQVVQSDDRARVVKDFLDQRRPNFLSDPVDELAADAEAEKVFGVLVGKLGA